MVLAHHSAPEAFTPEAENEEVFGPDNWGGKQAQACTTWYAGLYTGLAGLDFDHEGLTITPWGSRSVDIRGLLLRGVAVDLKIRGRGSNLGSLKLNGKSLPAGLRKIGWKELKGKSARIEIVRSEKAPRTPVIVRADGLRVTLLKTGSKRFAARIGGEMTSEVIVQVKAGIEIQIDGKAMKVLFDPSTSTVSIPFPNQGDMELCITW